MFRRLIARLRFWYYRWSFLRRHRKTQDYAKRKWEGK